MKWSTIFKYFCLALGAVQSVLGILAYFGIQPSEGGNIADVAATIEESADIHVVGDGVELITDNHSFFEDVRNGEVNFWRFISGPIIHSDKFCYRDYSAKYWWGDF